MRPLDLAVIALYAVAMLAVGRYYKTRVQTSDDYLLGGRTISPVMIGLSLFATLTSTLSYLAYPGELIKNGPMMFAQLAAFPIVMLIVGWVLIPRIMQQEVTSGYELLEKRLGLSGRLLGATMFSAAMSSFLSGMNSASAVITTDFMSRLQKKQWSQHESVRVARIASVIIGVIAVLLSMFVGQLAANLLELCIKVVNLLTAPLFVLFFLSLFVPWAKPRGGIAATVASISVAVGIAFFKLGGLEFLWTAPASFVTGVIVGSLVSLPMRRDSKNGK